MGVNIGGGTDLRLAIGGAEISISERVGFTSLPVGGTSSTSEEVRASVSADKLKHVTSNFIWHITSWRRF